MTVFPKVCFINNYVFSSKVVKISYKRRKDTSEGGFKHLAKNPELERGKIEIWLPNERSEVSKIFDLIIICCWKIMHSDQQPSKRHIESDDSNSESSSDYLSKYLLTAVNSKAEELHHAFNNL